MPYVYIDNIRVPIEGETNLLALVRKAGIDLPTFCYNSELSTYGACRMCVVENEKGSIMASCSEVPWDGMKVFTNTPKLQKHRKMILELLLAAHCRDCTVCEKSGKCVLQSLAKRYNVKNIRFTDYREEREIDTSSPSIVRDNSKCILCGDCVRICDEIQAMSVLEILERGSRSFVGAGFNKRIADTNCVSCGQCSAVCPTGAITIKNDTPKVWKALENKDLKVIAQIAPAVRVAVGEEFGFAPGENLNGKIVAALKRLGFAEVFDTNLGADFTVFEEVKEYTQRIEKGFEGTMFTSCCPSWVRFVEEKYPEFLPNLSSCKSPMQMLGAISREYFNNLKQVDGKDSYMVFIGPCTAKKMEATRPEFTRNGRADIDAVITTQELIAMIKEAGIDFQNIEAESPGMPLGLSSGSGALFGASGGVMEAALRLVVHKRTGEALREIAFSGIRGLNNIKEATIDIGDGKELKVAVVSGLKNAEILMESIKAGEVKYDFVEIMACRSGCIAGAGQPYTYDKKVKEARAHGIYEIDQTSQIKRSEENPVLMSLYNGLLKGRTHELLHCPERKTNSKK